jgi:hypothetical protein
MKRHARDVDPGDIESLLRQPHGVVAEPARQVNGPARRDAAGLDHVHESQGRPLEVSGDLVKRQLTVDALHLGADVH